MIAVLWTLAIVIVFLAGYVAGRGRAKCRTRQVERERDDAWGYANDLLESPTFWREQRSIARAVAGSPDFGVFGRIADHAREN